MRRTKLYHFKVLELQQYEDLRPNKDDVLDENGVNISVKDPEEKKADAG